MITVLFCVIVGSGLLLKLGIEKKPLEIFALGYLFGFLITTLSLFIPIFLHIPLTTQIVLPIIGIESLLGVMILIKKRKSILFNKETITVIGIGIIGLILLSILVNMARPIFQWDAMTLYEFRSKIFASGKLIPTAFGKTNTSDLSYYYGYPPLLSLAHAATYIFGFQDSLMLYSAFYISLIVLFYYGLKEKKVRSTIASFSALLVAASPIFFEYSISAYTNLPYAVFIVTSILFALAYIRYQKKLDLFITFIMAFGSICIRQMEPFFLLPFILIIIHDIEMRKINKVTISFLCIVLLFLVRFGWEHYVEWDLGRMGASGTSSVLPFPKLADVISYLITSLKQYHIYFALFFFVLFVFTKYITRQKYILFTILIAIIMLIAGTFLLARNFAPWREIPDSVSRMMMFLIPLIVYYFANILEFNQNK